MADNSCCAAGTWPQPPRREPSVYCSRDGIWIYVQPDAKRLLDRYGQDPCNAPHPNGEVRRQDAETYLRGQKMIL